jgi:uncharacterized membrane protein YqhA
MWQTIIHVAFLASAMAVAAVDRIMPSPQRHARAEASDDARH